jgi:hypothetical protein
MSRFTPKPTSPARERLQETIAAREAVNARVAELQASIAKLESEISAPSSAAAALANLAAMEDSAALRWARGEGDRPAPDVEQRERLARQMAAEAQSSASATRAKDTLSAELEAERRKLVDIARFTDAAIIEVITDEAAPLINALKAAAIEVASRIESLEVASVLALEMAEKGRNVTALSAAELELRALGHAGMMAFQNPEAANATPPEAFRAATGLLERFSNKLWGPVGAAILAATESFPQVLEKHIAARSAWLQFAQDLRDDSGVVVNEAVS